MPTRAELDAAYRRNVEQLRAAQAVALERAWRGLGQWTGDGPYVDRWLRVAVPVMLGTQRQVAAQTVAYSNATMGAGVSLDLDAYTGDALRGVDHRGTYQRGFSTVRKALERGRPFDDAVGEGLARQQNIAATDAQMAKVRSADDSLREAGVRRYRRVLNGETNCGLCVAAASKFYNVGDLAPIHGACDCSVVGVLDESVEGEHLTAAEDQYADVLKEAGSTSAKDLLDTKVETRQHGELGPVLTWDGQHFKGPGLSHKGTPA